MKNPNPDRVKDVLFSNAEDLGAAGIDVQTGHGRVTTDFIDVGKIVSDIPPEPVYLAEGVAGCKGVLVGLVVGVLIWAVVLGLIFWLK